jgi:predicted nucleotidyltransferase
MRLLQSEVDAIKSTFLALFHSGKIYLFGSRVDDSKRGGDIDLFLELDDNLSVEELTNLKTKFKLMLYDSLGEQKIDIVFAKDENRSIEQEIRKKRVEL